VWEAYWRVKENKGAAGVGGVAIEDFEADLKNNLYRIWNRMSSVPQDGGADGVVGQLRRGMVNRLRSAPGQARA
jgi:hypothetical protein